VAHAARWDSTVPQRGMFHVAVLTADLGLVFASLGLYGLRLLRVTVGTLGIGYGLTFQGSCPRRRCLALASGGGPNTRSLFATKSAD